MKFFRLTEIIIGCAVATAATSCTGADDDLVAQGAQAHLAIEDGSVEPDDDSQVQVSSGDDVCNPAVIILYGDAAALEAECEADALAESEDEVSWLPATEQTVPVESNGAQTPDPSSLTEEDAAEHDDASADRAQE